jgi:hypothetical protein
VAPDDNETESRTSSSSPPGASPAPPASLPPFVPLPPHVERALAEARAKAAAPGTPPKNAAGSRWLALIPVTAAALAFLLMMPREALPEDVPLPQIDAKAVEAIRNDDIARAASTTKTPLGGDIRAVGTALRELNRALAQGDDAETISLARVRLEDASRNAMGGDQARGFDALRTLRAVELEEFLVEVTRFEATGKITTELAELGGGFVDRMSAAGWIEGKQVVLDENERRVAYKLVWAATVGVDRTPGLALSLDEQRVLYTLYLKHPHAPETERQGFVTMRREATTEGECKQAIAKEGVFAEQWRADKIKRLGDIDPTYPTGYALGVAFYRAGRYDLAGEQFRTWVAKHPDGPLALRARNYMKAAFTALGPS